MQELSKIFPVVMLEEIKTYLYHHKIQEIRIRENKPCIVILGNDEIVTKYVVKRDDIKYILQRISNYSLYAFEEEIKQGFLTIKGGHRIGLAGECVMEGDNIKTIKYISSLNVRVCKEIIGCGSKVINYLLSDGIVNNTLIISPPKCGKTTMLRDISRELSNKGKKISIIDERSEIAACYKGIPQMNVGIRTDVLDNCIKSKGMMMAIRSLSPDVIICDEIGTNLDVEALVMAFNSGVNIITTIHGFNIEDFLNRKVFNEIIENNILQRIIVLSNREGVGTIDSIYSSKKSNKEWERLL